MWKKEWMMGTTMFDETWWTKAHGMFGSHEEGGLLGSQAPMSKDCLLP
jgi:hypothetical protein